MPEEKSLRIALDELQKTEDAYLALFTGRSTQKSFSAMYYFTPKTDTVESNVELLRFSTKNGITEKSTVHSSPVTITLNKENRTGAISEFLALMPKPLKNYIYYRIPDAAKVTVVFKGDLIYSGIVKVYQYGVILPYASFLGK